MKKITIKDIAQEAGVSISAVSLVLNNKPCRISEVKRRLIYDIADKYEYTANSIARSLVTKETHTLGIIIPDIENIFFSALVKSLEANCRKAGYMLMIANSDDKLEYDLELIHSFSVHQIDALFIVVSNESYKNPDKVKHALKKLTIPYMMVDRVYDDFQCDKAYFDNEAGAYEAARYLLANGHRKIGCVSAADSYNGQQRLSGYKRAMESYGLSVPPEFVVDGDYRLQSGYKAAKKLVDNTTAAFICNDMMALGFLKYLYEAGLTVPEDYSLVSYDYIAHPYLIDISLSSVEQNVMELGETSCKILLKRIAKTTDKPVDKLLMPRLIMRDSVKYTSR